MQTRVVLQTVRILLCIAVLNLCDVYKVGLPVKECFRLFQAVLSDFERVNFDKKV